MKTSSAELKRTARENLSGKYGVAMLAMITVSLIPSALLYPFADNASHKRQFIIWLLLLLLCFS